MVFIRAEAGLQEGEMGGGVVEGWEAMPEIKKLMSKNRAYMSMVVGLVRGVCVFRRAEDGSRLSGARLPPPSPSIELAYLNPPCKH